MIRRNFNRPQTTDRDCQEESSPEQGVPETAASDAGDDSEADCDEEDWKSSP